MLDLSAAIYKGSYAGIKRLAKYHQYEVHGIDNVPRTGPGLIITNHSLATYDAFLLGVHLLDEIGRLPHVLADRIIFRTPVLGRVFTDLGMVNGTRDNALKLLREGEMIGIAPGGMREQLRSSKEKYEFDWSNRLGFVWMSMLTGAPVILAACPTSDDIFDVMPNPVTPWLYKRLKLPLPIFRGRGLSPLPRPVKLWHLLSEPIVPDVAPDQVEREDVERQHQRIVDRMVKLMAESIRLKGEQS